MYKIVHKCIFLHACISAYVIYFNFNTTEKQQMETMWNKTQNKKTGPTDSINSSWEFRGSSSPCAASVRHNFKKNESGRDFQRGQNWNNRSQKQKRIMAGTQWLSRSTYPTTQANEACGGLKYLGHTLLLIRSPRGAFPPFFDVTYRTML